jgi:hypothetical protein
MTEEDMQGMADCMKEVTPEATDAENADPTAPAAKGMSKEKMAVSIIHFNKLDCGKELYD